MKIPSGFVLQDLKPYEINLELNRIKTVVNGQLQFGTLSGSDKNMDGVMILHTFKMANVEESVTHALGSVPIGYLVLRNGNGGVIYDGTSTTTTNVIFLKSTTGNNTVLMFILR